MIIADPKPFEQIKGFVQDYEKILVVGCGTCVTVCLSGGEAQMQTLAAGLRIVFQREGKPKTILEDNVQRQCDEEFVVPILERVREEKIEAVITLACGVGVNFLADRTGNIPVFPGVNTTFYGASVEPGVWAEMCAGCGDCITHLTGGICPIARCSKRLLNGPCGGSTKGKCEVDRVNIDCVWQLIYDRLIALGRVAQLEHAIPMKNWQPSAHGGVRRSIREGLYRLDYKQET
jgi:ferredoxin